MYTILRALFTLLIVICLAIASWQAVPIFMDGYGYLPVFEVALMAFLVIYSAMLLMAESPALVHSRMAFLGILACLLNAIVCFASVNAAASFESAVSVGFIGLLYKLILVLVGLAVTIPALLVAALLLTFMLKEKSVHWRAHGEERIMIRHDMRNMFIAMSLGVVGVSAGLLLAAVERPVLQVTHVNIQAPPTLEMTATWGDSRQKCGLLVLVPRMDKWNFLQQQTSRGGMQTTIRLHGENSSQRAGLGCRTDVRLLQIEVKNAGSNNEFTEYSTMEFVDRSSRVYGEAIKPSDIKRMLCLQPRRGSLNCRFLADSGLTRLYIRHEPGQREVELAFNVQIVEEFPGET